MIDNAKLHRDLSNVHRLCEELLPKEHSMTNNQVQQPTADECIHYVANYLGDVDAVVPYLDEWGRLRSMSILFRDTDDKPHAVAWDWHEPEGTVGSWQLREGGNE